MLLMILLPKLVCLDLTFFNNSTKCWNVFTGHKVLRLPVAHCELNPIELAWAQVKEHVRIHNQKFTLKEVEKLVHEGISLVTPIRWKKIIEHTRNKVEDHYWDKDGLYELMIEDFIINVGNSSEESPSSSELSSSGED